MDLDYTTGTPDRTSIERICLTLQNNGAREVSRICDGDRVIAIEFIIEQPNPRRICYRITPDIDSVHSAMERNPRLAPRQKNREQATRAAWLIVYRWIDGQLLMYQSGQATFTQLFFGFEVGSIVDRSTLDPTECTQEVKA